MTEFWHRLNWIDFIVFVIIVRALYVGSKRGLIPELATLIGLVVAQVVSLQHAGWVVSLITKRVSLPVPETWIHVLLIVVLFIATYLIFGLIQRGLSKLLRLETATGLNKWGGLLLGFLRGGYITSLILVVLSQAPSSLLEKGIKEDSLSGPYLIQAAPKVYETVLQVYPFRTGAGSLTAD